MKIDYLKDNCLNGRSRLAAVLLLAVSAFAAILILTKVATLSAASARAEELVREAITNGKADAKTLEEQTAKSKALADELKRNNLFAPAPPKQHPVKGVSGILGNEVLINGRWYKVGDKIGNAKVACIEPTRVKIEWEGTQKIFTPMGESGSEEQGGPRRSRPDVRRTPRNRKTRTARASMVVVGADARGRGRKGGFGNLSEKQRAALKRAAEKKQKSLIGKGEFKKPLKPAGQKKQASPKKDVTQAKKASGGTKTKKQATDSKAKK